MLAISTRSQEQRLGNRIGVRVGLSYSLEIARPRIAHARVVGPDVQRDNAKNTILQ